MLSMNTLLNKDVLIIELDGALDSVTGSDFKSWIEEKMLAGHRAFALDCTRLEYISSRGIGSLLETQSTLESSDGMLVLFSLSQEVLNLFIFLKLNTKITVFSDLNSSLEFLRSKIKTTETKAADPVSTDEDQIEQDSKDLNKDEVKSELRDTAAQSATVTPQTASISSEPVAIQETAATSVTVDQLEAVESVKIQKPAEPEITTEFSEAQTQSKPATTPQIPESQEPNPVNNPTEPTSNEPQKVSDYATPQIRMLDCANCGARLRITKPGKYLCPACRYTFKIDA